MRPRTLLRRSTEKRELPKHHRAQLLEGRGEESAWRCVTGFWRNSTFFSRAPEVLAYRTAPLLTLIFLFGSGERWGRCVGGVGCSATREGLQDDAPASAPGAREKWRRLHDQCQCKAIFGTNSQYSRVARFLLCSFVRPPVFFSSPLLGSWLLGYLV